MIPRIILSLFILAFSFVSLSAQEITWLTDLEQAKALSRETGKPLLYDFTAKWCGPCRRMDREFWPKPEVAALVKDFICVKVNFDLEKSFAARYGVNAIPNVVFTDPWGRGLLGQRGFGAGTEAEILGKIKFLPKDFSSLREAGNKLEADDKNVDSLHQFAAFYQEQKIYWMGNEYYKRLIKVEADAGKRENILLNMAFNYLRLEEAGDAIDTLENLQREYPKSPQNETFLYGLTLANLKKNKQQNASKFLLELKQKFPASKFIEHAEKSVAESTTGQK